MQYDGSDSALLQATLEAAVDAIVMSDATGQILRANPAACRMFQFEPDEMLGKNVSMLMPRDTAKQHDGYIRHHIDTGEKRIIGTGRDVDGMRKDGSIFPLHLSVGQTTVGDKRFFIGILHDLTLRNATQNALARSQRLDAIGQMTGGIAHDFNNLLTVVIGNLELLQMRGSNEQLLPLINDALEAAEMGEDLTSRLMVFARKSHLMPVESDLRELCEKTLTMLRRTLGSNYTIEKDFAENLDKVMVDPVQLQSTLVNLTLNARDAMGCKGQLLISVSNITIDDAYMAQETDIEPGDYVRLSVSDDGAGMSIEAQQRAFEPFFSTKSDKDGTGLGLAVVYGFVRQSGGHITLYSELGLGTSFGLYFPAVRDSGETTEPDQPKPTTTPRTHGHGETILIVEDNPRVRKFSVERIRDLGFSTQEAETGDAAYRMLCDGVAVDVVFTDLVMPGDLNGYDLAAKIASDFPDIRVLMTSGYASDVVTGSMAHDQAFDILHKPYRQSDLAKRLQALLTAPSGG